MNEFHGNTVSTGTSVSIFMNTNQTASEEQKSPIYKAKRAVEAATSSLSEIVAQLEQRLKPIINLRSEAPTPKMEPIEKLLPSRSHAAEWLSKQDEQLLQINGRLTDILSTLEI